ncbi:DUF3127 domain-containing protein [Roseimaritima ulvae]|uniref:DUF3127 domain-containing protein n=1 Tax=Roseimaritima ulvae TaxID=980254 RepID=A0A5B9R8K8_9BACT|nr:DUF3127 domain-containing protein [Roseimaritima ulvae]QEG42963.1 hypothetical protein UC8_50060 [Roseimaritima ulvae]
MSNDAKVTGVVHVIEETKTYGQKGFRKRLVVLEQELGSFTNYVPIEFIRDACDTVDDLTVGDQVEVTYRLSGRKWQKDANSDVRYFLNAEGMSFQKLDSGNQGGAGQNANDSLSEAAFDEDDVPF